VTGKDDSAIWRVQAWRAGLRMFEERPLLGVGYQQFRTWHTLEAHNSFVQALAEGGLLGALAWVGLYYWSVLTLTRVRRIYRAEQTAGALPGYAAALQAGLLGYLTAAMFLHCAYDLVPLVLAGAASAIGADVL